MRALIVLFALVATPYVAGVAQGRTLKGNTSVRPADVTQPGLGHDDAHCAMRADLHPDSDINKCDAVPTPPPPPPTGAEIHGLVFLDANADGLRDPTESGIPNWSVMLSGTSIPAVQTDGNGNYAFTGLPAGTYTVCEGQRFAFFQTAPQTGTACGSGIGYTITLTTGEVRTGIDFGNFN
ncbi:MAG TPA: SdrD B-like domain-containing protein [Gemmatimonadales bacterium]|nr:SdrD B-like domain-containing protein [Gemmatimonadales bacterium]